MSLFHSEDERQGITVIARIWQGITLTTKAGQYLVYLKQRVIPFHQKAEGKTGCFIMKEKRGDLVNFLLLSFWDSENSLANFVGADLEVMNLTSEEKDLLTAFESNARNYTIVSKSNNKPEGLGGFQLHD